MLKSVGTTEWIIIGLIVLLLFGGKKIPELFRGLAESVKEFKKAAKGSDKNEE
jgi:sec-independent protein translocase protein TatA